MSEEEIVNPKDQNNKSEISTHALESVSTSQNPMIVGHIKKKKTMLVVVLYNTHNRSLIKY